MSAALPSAIGLGDYPTRYDVAALPLRRQKAAFHFLARISVIVTLLNIVAAGVAIALLPMKSSSPEFIIEGSSDTGVYQADEPPVYMQGGLAYAESAAVDYVIGRNEFTLDNTDMQRVWGDSGLIASTEAEEMIGLRAWSKPYLADLADDVKQGKYKDAIYRGSKELIPGSVYQVDFDVQPVSQVGLPLGEAMKRRAVVEITFDSKGKSSLANPMGMTVVAYSDEERRS